MKLKLNVISEIKFDENRRIDYIRGRIINLINSIITIRGSGEFHGTNNWCFKKLPEVEIAEESVRKR